MSKYIQNPHLDSMEEDVLYHIALSNKSHDLKEMFNDIQFVCMGGSPNRMTVMANFFLKFLNIKLPAGQSLCNIAGGSDRYVMYKVGPVLCVSHGMGVPSLSIIFHELLKLLHHADCKNVTFFRVGSSGGLGLEPGTVVVSKETVDGMLNSHMELITLGEKKHLPAVIDQKLCKEILGCAQKEDVFDTVLGTTMCANDFYEGQGRLDGAFCNHSEDDKMNYLRRLHSQGVRNIEMEAVCFAAMSHRAGVKSAVVCVTLLDRLKNDQVSTPKETLKSWEMRPQLIVARYIKSKLG